MVHRWHTTTTLTKCVVLWCCGCCFEYPQQHILTKCVVVWCCGCLLKCVVVGTRNNTHNTIQQHTLLMLLLCATYEPSYKTRRHTTTSIPRPLYVKWTRYLGSRFWFRIRNLDQEHGFPILLAILWIITLYINGKGGPFGMVEVCALPSAF